MKEKTNNCIDKIKYALKNSKITIILGIFTIVPIIISLNVFDGDSIVALAVVPVLYRLVCNIIIWIMKKSGKSESNDLFNSLSRISVFISFVILCCLSVALEREEMGIIEIILLSICIAYYDKLLIAIFIGLVGSIVGGLSITSEQNSVSDLMSNARTSFDNSDGTKIYKDANGKMIGKSSYNEKTGETTYWNERLEYIGKSEKSSNGNEKYFDSKLNYKGQSEKNSNGNTSYYDEKLNYKGRTRKNSNGTSSYFKK